MTGSCGRSVGFVLGCPDDLLFEDDDSGAPERSPSDCILGTLAAGCGLSTMGRPICFWWAIDPGFSRAIGWCPGFAKGIELPMVIAGGLDRILAAERLKTLMGDAVRDGFQPIKISPWLWR
ncbi:hypothetical protein ACLOJK_037316 [Asimina triloba]